VADETAPEENMNPTGHKSKTKKSRIEKSAHTHKKKKEEKHIKAYKQRKVACRSGTSRLLLLERDVQLGGGVGEVCSVLAVVDTVSVGLLT
jgi:hypothetical protein